MTGFSLLDDNYQQQFALPESLQSLDQSSAGGGSSGNPLSSLIGMFAGAGALNAGVAGLMQYRAGQMTQAAHEYNARIILDQMKEMAESTEGKFDVLMGSQRSKYAKAGVDISSGSPLLILTSTAMAQSEEVQRIKEAGTEKAALEDYYGDVAAWTGKQQGISTFLTGLQKMGMGYMAAQKGGFAAMM